MPALRDGLNKLLNPLGISFGGGASSTTFNDPASFEKYAIGNNVTKGLTSGVTSALKGFTGTASSMIGNAKSQFGLLTNQLDNWLSGTVKSAFDTSAIKAMADESAAVRQYNHDEAALSRLATAEENQKNRDFNAQQAQLDRDWQTELSNTQFQRTVADMRAAGVNPLYASQVGGAGVPSGSSASVGSSGGMASASVGYTDYSKAKDSDKESMMKSVFGDLFSDYLSSALKMSINVDQMQNQRYIAALQTAGSLLGKLIPW